MTLTIPIIPEDAWVALPEWRTTRIHRVFAVNGDVLTHCSRWLKRGRVTVVNPDVAPGVRCLLCDRSAA